MGDLQDPRLMYLKGGLFVLGGVMAGLLVWLQAPTLYTAALLGLTIWCFCRAYYFAFYVIEHYIDPTFKFAGLGAFAAYLVKRRAARKVEQAGRAPRDVDDRAVEPSDPAASPVDGQGGRL